MRNAPVANPRRHVSLDEAKSTRVMPHSTSETLKEGITHKGQLKVDYSKLKWCTPQLKPRNSESLSRHTREKWWLGETQVGG